MDTEKLQQKPAFCPAGPDPEQRALLARKCEDGVRASVPVWAGAATVAREPRVNSQRAQEARTSSKVSLGYGGGCLFFFFNLLYSDLWQIHRGLCVSDY